MADNKVVKNQINENQVSYVVGGVSDPTFEALKDSFTGCPPETNRWKEEFMITGLNNEK